MIPSTTTDAAQGAGCALVEDERGRAQWECRDGWTAARFLVGLTETDDPRAAWPLVAKLGSVGGADARARDAYQAFKNTIRFEPEEGEQFQSPRELLKSRVGDCDCHSRLMCSALGALGVPARARFLAPPGGPPLHVSTQANVNGQWQWLETTIGGAAFGEHPVAAALRTGALRDDVSTDYKMETSMGVGDSYQFDAGHMYLLRLGGMAPLAEGDDVEAETDSHLSGAGLANITPLAPTELAGACAVLDASAPPPWFSEGAIGAAWTAWAIADAPTDMTLAGRALAPWAWIDAVIDVESGAVQTSATHADEAPTTKEGQTMGAAIGAVKYTADLPTEFFRQVFAMALRFQQKGAAVRGIDLLKVWNNESGVQANIGTIAFGLNQIMNLAGVGWTGTSTAYKQLGAVGQLPYVERYFDGVVSPANWPLVSSIGALYLVNFLPALLSGGTDAARVLVRKNGTGFGGAEASYYAQNMVFDPTHKGYITVGDLTDTANRAAKHSARFQEIEARYYAESGDSPLPSPANIVAAIGFGTLAFGLLKHFLG